MHQQRNTLWIGLGLLTASMPLTVNAYAQDVPPDAPTDAPATSADQNQAEMRTLMAQLQALKASYADQVRRLRDVDAQVQALQSRLAGRAGDQPLPAAPQAAGRFAETSPQPIRNPQGRTAPPNEVKRSVEDVLQQEHAVFDRKLTMENGFNYSRYDRKQLTLNGFLALDAIFLGNIAIENVEADTLTYSFAARYGVSPRWTLNLDVPYLARRTTYQKGGAGGSAAATAEEKVFGSGLGDASVSANFRLLPETASRPDTVLTFGVTAPTGRSPYGIDWNVLERDSDDFIRFAVPTEQPTGNGLWAANLGLSVVKTLDPAILFGNLGFSHSFARDFGDLDNSPDTRNPGRVQLGNAYAFGGGVAFAFNTRTSLSLSFNDRVTAKARVRPRDAAWTSVIGSDAHAASFNMGVTYAMSRHSTLVTQLGIGLTPDAPDFSLTMKVPYIF